jgi:hypothetical protein
MRYKITNNSIVLSVVSMMIADSGVYVVIIASMHLIDNWKKYIDSETGKKDSSKSLSNVIKNNNSSRCFRVSTYRIVKFTSVYMILQSNIAHLSIRND